MNQEELLQVIDQAAEDGREELNLSQKGLTELPKEIGKLENLTTLQLWGNQISEIPKESADLKNLRKLYLFDNQITDISEGITNLRNLEVLNLNQNQISEIPETITNLTRLEVLELNRNHLTEITNSIISLTTLWGLSLQNNYISEIPDAIDQLINLKQLHLNNNCISKIPATIKKLTNLTYLDLSYNNISEIPDAITTLINLESLDFTENQISEIPDAIDQLINLEGIGLDCNQISEIPESIINLENLKRIDISFNPLKEPFAEIGIYGIHAIRAYFLNQQLSHYKDNNTMIKTTSNREKIFVSYSHKDSKWLKEFQTHIKPFVRADGFEIWDDTKIESGSEWREEIEKALASAKVAVLLVTHHFIASDFIHNKELPPLFDAAEKEGLTIFWIPIRASNYTETKIEKYQSAHPPDKPLLSLNTSKRDEAWVSICKKIAHKMK